MSRAERGVLRSVDLATIARLLDALLARATLSIDVPYLADRRRQREPAHVRCTAYVAQRLEASGWLVAHEVGVVDQRWRRWMDILAYLPSRRTVLIGEIKTDLEDVGRIERTVASYERLVWSAARKRGWRPAQLFFGLLILDTGRTRERIRQNQEFLRQAFPGTSSALSTIIAGTSDISTARRSMVLMDPKERRRSWLHDVGRRPPSPYLDYADFMRKVAALR